ncbi:MAG: TatD family hydrolase [Candidatus Woesearchaeota archaeon]
MIDCHCHLDRLDHEGAVKRAVDAGVRSIITNGLNYETNLESLSLAKKYPIVKAALGSYPGEVLDEKALSLFEEDFIAIGEIGLDYSIDAKGQKEVFQRMLDLAIRLDKPVIVHSRKAEEDCISMLEKAGLKVVMHCFSGKLKLVKRIVKNGWYLSIPTNIVRSTQFQRVVEEVPLSSILTETDAPYLSPFPEYPNEPAFIEESIRMISKIKGMDPVEVKNLIFMNYQRVFLC